MRIRRLSGKNKKIIIFIEKIVKYRNENNENVIYLLLDFPTRKSNINLFFERIQFDFIDGKSMLEIKNIEFDDTGEIPKEDHYYYLPDSLIEEFGWVEYNQNNSEFSNYIALYSNGITDKIKFDKPLTYKDLAEEKRMKSNLQKSLKPIDKIDTSKIEVNVYDVGQGNWNEILFSEKFLIIYDLGASSSQIFSDTFNRVTIPQNRISKINSLIGDGEVIENRILIISHWDIDHYNGIFNISDNIISSFDFCLVPNRIENQTTQRAMNKLMNSTVVYPIEMNNKIRGVGTTSRLTEIYSSNNLKIYKGTKGSNRNKRGLLISLHSKENDFIFPADHHYNQINDYVIPNCRNKSLNIVVPHHGGRAGNHYIVNRWTNYCEDSVISTNGRYGHPISYVENIFKTKFNSVHRTDNCVHTDCTCTSNDYSKTI